LEVRACSCWQSAADRLQPLFFPEDQAPGLAPPVRGSVTTGLQVDSPFDPASATQNNRVAGLVRTFVNLKPLAAEREHFWHEGHPVGLAIAVQCVQYFFFASYLYPITYPQFAVLLHVPSKSRHTQLLC
jgi:hypothetical protein